MPRQITSPVEKWPGTVTLCDPLTFPQVVGLQDAFADVETAREKAQVKNRVLTQAKLDSILLEPVCACVQKWELDGFPEDVSVETFPATPQKPAAELVAWLIGEVMKIYTGETAPVPNA